MSGWKDRLAARLDILARADGLTIEAFAARLGTTAETVAQWLRGECSPTTVEEYERVARELGIHPARLLYGVNPELNEEDHPELSEGRKAILREFRRHAKAGTFPKMRDPKRRVLPPL